MVQKATPPPRRRGRPPSFDESAVLTGAIRAFWDRGFDGTTLADLEAETGVDRSTLYNSFGGKAGLYRSATDAYLSQAEGSLFQSLYEGTDDGYADLATFFSRLRAGLTAPEARCGCLIVNDMAASPEREPSRRYLELLQGGLRAALGRTSADAAEIERRTQLLSLSVIGINLVSKATRDPRAVQAAIDAATTQVEEWRGS